MNETPHNLSSNASREVQVTQEVTSVPNEKTPAEMPRVNAEGKPDTQKVPIPSSPAETEAPAEPAREHNSDFYRTHIMERDNVLHRMLSVPQTRELQAPPDIKRVTLYMRGMKEQVILTEERVVILGRADLRSGGFKPDVDLTPYGGRERGVSRAHVRLHVRDSKLFLTDLYSANGTFMGGERLEAEKPYEIHNGDELLLGALGIRVEID